MVAKSFVNFDIVDNVMLQVHSSYLSKLPRCFLLDDILLLLLLLFMQSDDGAISNRHNTHNREHQPSAFMVIICRWSRRSVFQLLYLPCLLYNLDSLITLLYFFLWIIVVLLLIQQKYIIKIRA